MAVSSTRGTKKTVDGLVLMALKRAALVDMNATTSDPQVSQQLSFGRELLDMILDSLANVADVRYVDFHDVTCVASQQAYTLAEEIIDVIGDGVYLSADEANTEEPSSQTLITQVNRHTWHIMSSKNSTGTPTIMFPHRGVEDSYQISLKLWPKPTEAGTARIMAQRAPADTLVGSDTIDVKSGGNEYLLHRLAGQLADSLNGAPGRAKALLDEADKLKRELRIFASMHAKTKVTISGQNIWRRGS